MMQKKSTPPADHAFTNSEPVSRRVSHFVDELGVSARLRYILKRAKSDLNPTTMLAIRQRLITAVSQSGARNAGKLCLSELRTVTRIPVRNFAADKSKGKDAEADKKIKKKEAPKGKPGGKGAANKEQAESRKRSNPLV